jgi:hypothetical protein
MVGWYASWLKQIIKPANKQTNAEIEKSRIQIIKLF